MDRVLLITMPFSNANTPALGISLLRGILSTRGIPCDIRYLQLPFAAQVGLDRYCRMASCYPSVLLGDWLFAHILFPDQLRGTTQYVNDILRNYVAAHGRAIPDDLINQFLGVQALVSPYLDFCMESIPWEQYDLIGFSSAFSQNTASLALAQRIKRQYPGKIIAFGGANCEAEMGLELHRQFPFIDYVCSGESDWLFPELVQRLGRADPIDDLQGLVYRKDGQTRANGSHALPFLDLDALPFLDFDDYFAQLEKSNLPLEPGDINLMMETSRGCWWGAKSQCSFCGLNSSTLSYRSKSSPRVLDEIAYLAHRYPSIKQLIIVDNILDMRYFRDVIPGLIENDLDISLFYEVKSNLRKDQLRQLKRARVEILQPGIESLDSGILLLMKKGVKVIQNLELLKWACELGIHLEWNLITGFPGEDPEAYKRMAAMIPSVIHLKPPSNGVSRLRLDRFSPYFQEPETFGILNVRPVKTYKYVYPFPDESLYRLAYFFDFDYADGSDPEDYVPQFDRAVQKWYQGYQHGDNGSLKAIPSNERLTLIDTRPGADQGQRSLQGISKEIYEFCDQGQTLQSILDHLNHLRRPLSSQNNPDEVKEILKDFIAARIMIFADNRYLSLAIPVGNRNKEFIDFFVDSLARAAN